MRRLLPVILLVSCAANEPSGTVSEEDRPVSHRTVDRIDLPLTQTSNTNTGQPVTQEFRRRDTHGWVRKTGTWRINAPVTHTRLRCATYETGIQLGKGDPACSDVRWLTNFEPGTRQTQCNAATVIHTGGGESAAMKKALPTANCVRVVTRCDGPC